MLHFHQVLFSLTVSLRPSVAVPLSPSFYRACLLRVSFSLPSNHLTTTTNTTITLQASVLDGAGVDDWTGDQLFFKIHMDRRIYKLQRVGRRHESSVLQCWMGQALTIGLVTNWLGQNNVCMRYFCPYGGLSVQLCCTCDKSCILIRHV